MYTSPRFNCWAGIGAAARSSPVAKASKRHTTICIALRNCYDVMCTRSYYAQIRSGMGYGRNASPTTPTKPILGGINHRKPGLPLRSLCPLGKHQTTPPHKQMPLYSRSPECADSKDSFFRARITYPATVQDCILHFLRSQSASSAIVILAPLAFLRSLFGWLWVGWTDDGGRGQDVE